MEIEDIQALHVKLIELKAELLEIKKFLKDQKIIIVQKKHDVIVSQKFELAAFCREVEREIDELYRPFDTDDGQNKG